MSRKRPASGPLTRILPSVEASSNPTACRALFTSRATASCGPSPSPEDSNRAGATGRRVPTARRASRASRGGPCGGSAGTACPAPRPRWRPSRSACRAGGRWWCRPAGWTRQGLRQHRQPVDVAQLPLIGRHAERGVALGVLDALEPLARGEFHVRHLHVVLEVEPHLRLQPVARALRHDPDGSIAASAASSTSGSLPLGWPLPRARPRRGHRPAPRPCASRPRPRPPHDEALPVGARGRAVGIGAELRARLVPGKLAAAMRPQVHDRRPAARHGDRVAGDVLESRARSHLRAERHALDPGACPAPATIPMPFSTRMPSARAVSASSPPPPSARRGPRAPSAPPAPARWRCGRRRRCWSPPPSGRPAPRHGSRHSRAPPRPASRPAGRCPRRPAAARSPRWRSPPARPGSSTAGAAAPARRAV
jgi:hypothetical protein